MGKEIDQIEEEPIGFNLETQKLHCVIVLDDGIGQKLSDKAGIAFFRAFIVEDRKTGEVLCNERYRYTHEDSWYRLNIGRHGELLNREEKVEYLAHMVETVMRIGLENLTKQAAPEGVVTRHYPPEPDDSEKTLEWLIAQDLMEIKSIDGTPVNQGTGTVN